MRRLSTGRGAGVQDALSRLRVQQRGRQLGPGVLHGDAPGLETGQAADIDGFFHPEGPRGDAQVYFFRRKTRLPQFVQVSLSRGFQQVDP